jgi:hypothetical protein
MRFNIWCYTGKTLEQMRDELDLHENQQKSPDELYAFDRAVIWTLTVVGLISLSFLLAKCLHII